MVSLSIDEKSLLVRLDCFKEARFLFLQFLSELSIFGRYSVILKNLHRLDCFGSLNLRFGFRMCFFFKRLFQFIIFYF